MDNASPIWGLLPFGILALVCIVAALVNPNREKHKQEFQMVLRDENGNVVLDVTGEGKDGATMLLMSEIEERFDAARTLKTMDKWLENMEFVFENNKQYLSEQQCKQCTETIADCKEARQERADEIAEEKAFKREMRRRKAEHDKEVQAIINERKTNLQK